MTLIDKNNVEKYEKLYVLKINQDASLIKISEHKNQTLNYKFNKLLIITFSSLAILTMMHSAMRLSMPGFIYAMQFIGIRYKE